MDATDVDSWGVLLKNTREFMEGPVYAAWKKRVEAQFEGRMKDSLHPMKSMEDALERNYSNGEVAGMMSAVMMFGLLAEECETEIRKQQKEEQDHVEE